MKTVASTLGVARSNLIERRDKVIQARGPYRKAEDAGPPTSHPGHHRRATYLRRSPGLGSLEPPSTQRWQAHGQHEAGAGSCRMRTTLERHTARCPDRAHDGVIIALH